MKECQQCKRCYTDEVSTCPEDGMPTFHSISGEPVLEGKYKLESRIGQGGMGVVYCARHAYLKTQHAIKVILPDLVGNDPQLVTRFRQEALAAAAIRHQNVIAVTDFGVVQGTMPFLVMEFVDGESLHDLLAREKRLAPDKAFELMAAICGGVGAAHRQGIVHRDLKPLNIMILKDRATLSESVKILDFGLAKIKSGELLGSFVQAQTTGLMGSPYYMAPEQWADEDPDAAADIYSLGVMLFQMLAGDVPFKGSSIPAIMKKHLTDPPPALADFGVTVSPQVELAVRHTLEKDRHARTQSVEQMVEELRSSIGYTSQSIHTTSTPTAAPLTVSSVHVYTRPPQSKVFVDNVAVGQSQPDGWLLIEGLQSGTHRLNVTKDGFQPWESSLICDGKPQQVVAQLTEGTVSPPANTANFAQTNVQNTPPNINLTQGSQSQMQQTAPPNYQSQTPNFTVDSQPKKRGFSPLMMAAIGIPILLLLVAGGVGGAYWLGIFGGKTNVAGTNSNVNAGVNKLPVNANVAPTPEIAAKNEMVKIDGGKFTMGRDDGTPAERPEHEAEVPTFWMDKTEVTNAEYAAFVAETGHAAPSDWKNNQPISGEEMLPVVRVSLSDAKDFAEWRSKRDKFQYHIPTEAEWEYAARNGGANNLYPWGDSFDADRAVVEQSAAKPVGSMPKGADKWGAQDLIGNVWEWTSDEAKLYPGSKGEILGSKEPKYMIRGGSYNSKSSGEKSISSTFRVDVPESKKDGLLGFRLVRSQ